MHWIPGLETSPGEGNGNPLQHSCLGNHRDRRAWGANSPWGSKELDIKEHIKEEEAGCSFIISDLEYLFLMLLFIARFPWIQIVYQ